jgi:hypothetical protein
LNEDELQDELDKLDALIAEEAIPDAATGRIEGIPAAAAKEKIIHE